MKANLLLQAHMGRLPLPIADYLTDTRTVLDNSLRILQARMQLVVRGRAGQDGGRAQVTDGRGGAQRAACARRAARVAGRGGEWVGSSRVHEP
jgi:hypothetical protein